MKILVFTNFERENSVYKLRLDFYLEYLKKNKYITEVYYNNSCKIEICDLIVIHRFKLLGLSVLQRIIKKKIPVIIETDDLLTEMDIKHPDYAVSLTTKSVLSIYRYMISGFTVSTDFLKSYFKEYNENITVIRNTLPFNIESGKGFSGGKTIAFVGTPTHQEDFNFLKQPLLKLLKSGIKILCFGFTPDFLKGEKNVIDLPFEKNYLKNLERFKNKGIQLGLAPLKNSIFNKAKSSIKYLEYTFAGIVGIYSNIEPYNEIKGGSVLENIPDEWYKVIKHLINDSKKLKKLYDKAVDEINEKYNFEFEAEKLWHFYKSVIKNKKIINLEEIKNNLIKSIYIIIKNKKINYVELYNFLKAIVIIGKVDDDLLNDLLNIFGKEKILDIGIAKLFAIFNIYSLLNLDYEKNMIIVFKKKVGDLESLKQYSNILITILEKMFSTGRYKLLREILLITPPYRTQTLPFKIHSRLLLLRLRLISEIGLAFEEPFNKIFSKFQYAFYSLNKLDQGNYKMQFGMANYYAGVYYKKSSSKNNFLQYFEKSAELFSGLSNLSEIDIYRIGSVFRELGKIEEALAEYKKVIKMSVLENVKAGAFFNIAKIYFEKNKKKIAEENFIECIKLNPEHKKAKEYLKKCRKLIEKNESIDNYSVS